MKLLVITRKVWQKYNGSAIVNPPERGQHLTLRRFSSRMPQEPMNGGDRSSNRGFPIHTPRSVLVIYLYACIVCLFNYIDRDWTWERRLRTGRRSRNSIFHYFGCYWSVVWLDPSEQFRGHQKFWADFCYWVRKQFSTRNKFSLIDIACCKKENLANSII